MVLVYILLCYCCTTAVQTVVCSHCTTRSTVLNTAVVHATITSTSRGTHDRIRGEINICLLLLLLSCCPSRKEEGGRQLDSCDSQSVTAAVLVECVWSSGMIPSIPCRRLPFPKYEIAAVVRSLIYDFLVSVRSYHQSPLFQENLEK